MKTSYQSQRRAECLVWTVITVLFMYSSTLLAEYAEEACGKDNHQRIRITDKGDLFSPGYKEGKNYPLSTTCSYYLYARPGMRIRLSFIDFDLESTEYCRGDWLKIYDGYSNEDPLKKILCGSILPRDILSSGNEFYLTLYSDFMVAAKGFHIAYESTYDQSECPNEVSCRNRKCGVPLSSVCDGTDDCGDGTDEQNCNRPLEGSSLCGQPAIKPILDFDERIVGGYEAVPGSWPWQADLQMNEVEPNGHMCGGALINSQWIVTASHCFVGATDKNTWRIHLGKHNKFESDHSEQVRYPERLVIYPDWPEEYLKKFKLNIAHDITLVKLNAPVKFTDEVQPICLPDNSAKVEPGMECYVTGWGETRGTGKSDALKQTKLIIQEGHRCLSGMRAFNDTTMVCAAIIEGQHGPCHGDSGGPMVCKIGKEWQLIGVTSFLTQSNGMEALCALRNVANSFVRISYWTEWIKDMLVEYS